MDYQALGARIKQWGSELGFQAVGIADADLALAEGRLAEWLAAGWHGEMDYMARHAGLRARPAELVPGTQRVISCRMDYADALEDEHVGVDADELRLERVVLLARLAEIGSDGAELTDVDARLARRAGEAGDDGLGGREKLVQIVSIALVGIGQGEGL